MSFDSYVAFFEGVGDMACCWFPREYDGQAYTAAQMIDVAWYEDMGNFYVPGSYFNQPVFTSRETALGSFFTGRPDLFPSRADVVTGTSVFSDPQEGDIFGILRDAIAGELFHESAHIRRIRLGNASVNVLSFDCFRTGTQSSLGATVNVIYFIMPYEYRLRLASGAVLHYGWNTPRIIESMQPGRWQDKQLNLVEDPQSVLERNFDWIAESLRVYSEIISHLGQPATLHNPSNPPDPPIPPAIIRREVFVPDLTEDGGLYGQVTDIYRAMGAQRLRVEVERIIEPRGFGVSEQMHPQHYVIGVRRDAYDSAARLAQDDQAQPYPPNSWFTGLFHGATQWDGTPTGSTSITEYHKENFPGRLTDDINVRVNDVQIDVAEVTTVPEMRALLRFQNVQDYAPPTDFPELAEAEVPSDYSSYMVPVNYRELDTPVLLPMMEDGLVFDRDFDLVIPLHSLVTSGEILGPWSNFTGLGFPTFRMPDEDIWADIDFSTSTHRYQADNSSNLLTGAERVNVLGWLEDTTSQGFRDKHVFMSRQTGYGALYAISTDHSFLPELPANVNYYVGLFSGQAYLAAGYKDSMVDFRDIYTDSSLDLRNHAFELWNLLMVCPLAATGQTNLYGHVVGNSGKNTSETYLSTGADTYATAPAFVGLGFQVYSLL